MLVITRKKDEKIVIAGNIEITILGVGRNRVRIGIRAPKEIAIQSHSNSQPAASRDNVRSIQLHRPAESDEMLPFAVGG